MDRHWGPGPGANVDELHSPVEVSTFSSGAGNAVASRSPVSSNGRALAACLIDKLRVLRANGSVECSLLGTYPRHVSCVIV